MHNSKKIRTQNYTETDNTNNTESSDKNSLDINVVYLERDNIIDNIFGMIASVEKNNHVSSDELEGIFNANVIDFKEVKYSTSYDSEKSKY